MATLPTVVGSEVALPQAIGSEVALPQVIDHYKVVRVRPWECVFGFIPFGGVQFTFFMLIVSYVSGVVQAVTLLGNEDYIGAGWLGIFLGVSLYYQNLMMSFQQAWSLALKSGKTGIMELDLLLYFSLATHIKEASLVFLAPYRVLTSPHPSLYGFANSSFSLLLSCRTLGTELQRSHLGAYYYQFGDALVKHQPGGQAQLERLKLWTLSAIASQVAFNTLFMYVFHPVVLVLLFLPVAFVNCCFGPAEHSALTRIREVMLEPVNLLAAFRSSVFGFGQWDPFANIQQGNRPAIPHCVAQIVRNIVMLLLMCFDFPTAPIRPMGWGVLHRELLVPVRTCIKESAEPFAGGLLRDFCPMGSSAYKALLELMVVLGLPLYMAGMIMLLKSLYFRTGKPHGELNNAMADMFSEIAQRLTEAPNRDDIEYREISDDVPADAH